MAKLLKDFIAELEDVLQRHPNAEVVMNTNDRGDGRLEGAVIPTCGMIADHGKAICLIEPEPV